MMKTALPLAVLVTALALPTAAFAQSPFPSFEAKGAGDKTKPKAKPKVPSKKIEKTPTPAPAPASAPKAAADAPVPVAAAPKTAPAPSVAAPLAAGLAVVTASAPPAPAAASSAAGAQSPAAGTPGIQTVVDVVFGRHTGSIQVLALALLIGGAGYVLIRKYVLNLDDLVAARRASYETALNESLAISEEVVEIIGELVYLEQGVASLLGSLDAEFPEWKSDVVRGGSLRATIEAINKTA